MSLVISAQSLALQKNYHVIWHNAQQIAVSLRGTTDDDRKSNSNNLSSMFGDLEQGDGPSLCETSMLQVIIREFIKPALHVEHQKIRDC